MPLHQLLEDGRDIDGHHSEQDAQVAAGVAEESIGEHTCVGVDAVGRIQLCVTKVQFLSPYVIFHLKYYNIIVLTENLLTRLNTYRFNFSGIIPFTTFNLLFQYYIFIDQKSQDRSSPAATQGWP